MTLRGRKGPRTPGVAVEGLCTDCTDAANRECEESENQKRVWNAVTISLETTGRSEVPSCEHGSDEKKKEKVRG